MKIEKEEQKETEITNPLDRFAAIMKKDVERMKNEDWEQGAHSRAYSSTCSFNSTKELPMSEAVKSTVDYMKDRSKVLEELDA